MKKPVTEDLEAFLRRQASEDLVTVLLELAELMADTASINAESLRHCIRCSRSTQPLKRLDDSLFRQA